MACQKVCKQGRDVVLASQTEPTPARIAFSITHCVKLGSLSVSRTVRDILKAIRAGVGWVWLARLVGMMYESKGQCTGKAPSLHLFVIDST